MNAIWRQRMMYDFRGQFDDDDAYLIARNLDALATTLGPGGLAQQMKDADDAWSNSAMITYGIWSLMAQSNVSSPLFLVTLHYGQPGISMMMVSCAFAGTTSAWTRIRNLGGAGATLCDRV